MVEPPGGADGGLPPVSRRRRFILVALFLVSFPAAAGAGSLFGHLLTFDIPEVRHLQDWKPPVVTTLYSADGQILYQFGAEKRIVVGLEQIPASFMDGLISTEDTRFYEHVGVDPLGIARAIIMDIIHLKKAQGGSTLTQQLARSLFLKPEKTWRRKLQEMLLALQIEKSFTKSEILTFYCNQVYMGHGRYGVEAAARYFFGKPGKTLSLGEGALLAGLVQRPEAYSPIRSPDRARARRNLVLSRMVQMGKADPALAKAASEQPVAVAKLPEEDNIAPYFVEEVRRYLDAKYGEVALYQEGLEVHTTLDPALQKAANRAIFEGLRVLDKRQGFRPVVQSALDNGGSIAEFTHPSWTKPPIVGRLRYGVITEVSKNAAAMTLGVYTARLGPESIAWTGRKLLTQIFKVGSVAPFLVGSIDDERKKLTVTFDQEPLVEGALLSLDPATGEIKALVGGYDFSRSEFDRAVQSYRQAGSAFKPFVYSAALDSGLSLAQTIFDEPTVFQDPATGEDYQPDNYYRRYYGVTTLRQAMEESRNIVSVKLLNQVGYKKTIDVARRMGITSPLRPYPSMALGTMEVSLIDLTTAFSVFPNQGVRVEPHFIRYVADREGTVREEAAPKVIEALRADVAYVMTYLLEGVTESGTGSAAQTLNRVVAGKTGTTEDYADAWFVGFSPSVVAGAWVGFDQKKSLGDGETGARAALPIWIDFMKEALSGLPDEKFVRPANVTYVPIDRRTGLRATVDSKCPSPFLEAFVEGTEPAQPCGEIEHFRMSLPYYLQRLPITRDLELQVDSDTLVRLVAEGQGDVELVSDGRELQFKDGDITRQVRLNIGRGDRKNALGQLEGQGPEGVPTQPPPPPEGEVQHPLGVDGRPATIIPIRSD